MADKVIQMQVRNTSNTAWDNLNPKTKANAVLMENGKSVEESVATHLADYTLQVPYVVATGTANTYSATLNPAPTSLVNGLALAVKIPVDSTGTSTLNVNGLGAKTIKKANGANVTNLKAGGIYTLRYDGVNFILQGEGASGNATASDLLLGKTATTDAGEITGTIPIKGAATITPGTTNQVIAAGQYLSGNQTILGSANLVPGNIKSGVNIFGVVGTVMAREFFQQSYLVDPGAANMITVTFPFVPACVIGYAEYNSNRCCNIFLNNAWRFFSDPNPTITIKYYKDYISFWGIMNSASYQQNYTIIAYA